MSIVAMKIGISLLFLCLISANTYSQDNNTITTIKNTSATKSPKVKVFPNPATTVVNILGLINTKKAEIAVTDLHGNTVLKHTWKISNNAINIPVPNLNHGVYVVTIQSPEQQVQTKFYKQ